MITSTGWSCGASLAAACGFGDGFVLLALKLMRSFDCGVLIWVGWVWFAFEDGVGAIGKRERRKFKIQFRTQRRERGHESCMEEMTDRLADTETEERRER